MSRALETLVRLQRARIDEVQRELALAVEARRDLDRARSELDHEAASEAAFAEAHPEEAAYGAFAPRIAQRKVEIGAADAALATQEHALRDALSEAFVELKKIELLLAAQADRERAAENAAEMAFLDEAAILQAARRER